MQFGLCLHCTGQLLVLARGEEKADTHLILHSTGKQRSPIVQQWTVPSKQFTTAGEQGRRTGLVLGGLGD